MHLYGYIRWQEGFWETLGSDEEMRREEHASTFDMQISESSELKRRGQQVSRPQGHSSLFHLSSSLIPAQPSLRTLPDSLMTAAKNQPTQNLRLSNLFYHENFFFFSVVFAQIFICIQEDVTILMWIKKGKKISSNFISYQSDMFWPVLKLIKN